MSKTIWKDLKVDEPGVEYWDRTAALYLEHIRKAQDEGDLDGLRSSARMLSFSVGKLQAAALRVIPQ